MYELSCVCEVIIWMSLCVNSIYRHIDIMSQVIYQYIYGNTV